MFFDGLWLIFRRFVDGNIKLKCKLDDVCDYCYSLCNYVDVIEFGVLKLR